MHFIGQVIVKRPDGSDFPGPGGRCEAVFRAAAVLVLNTVPAQIGHVAVDIRQRDGRHKREIHIHNIDFIQRAIRKVRIADLFHVAEEIPQVKIIFIYRPAGMCFDGFMVSQKIPQDLRRLCAIIQHCTACGTPVSQPLKSRGNRPFSGRSRFSSPLN